MDRRTTEGGRLSIRDVVILLLAALAVTGATFYWGWQSELGRADPAYMLPWLMPFYLPLAYWWRGLDVQAFGFLLTALGLLLIAGQVGLTFALVNAGLLGFMSPQIFALAVGAALSLAVASVMKALFMRSRLWGLVATPLIALSWFVISHIILDYLYTPRAVAADQPAAVLMTSLPLRWSGSGDMAAILSGTMEDDPALTAMEALGPVRMVDSLLEADLNLRATLILLHPRAMAPEELVAVDAHVRTGGTAVIFADALSSWHMRHPLGDARNPPITSLLTPLLDHWQIALDAVENGQEGERLVHDGGYGLRLLSAGRFSKIPSHCEARAERYLLRCNIGAGEVVLVGDADLLSPSLWQADVNRSRHLMKSDVFPWLALHIWRDVASDPWLRPLWVERA